MNESGKLCCPSCGSDERMNVDVRLGTRSEVKNGTLRRRWKCITCGSLFSTYEVVDTEYKKLIDYRRQVNSIKEYLKKFEK